MQVISDRNVKAPSAVPAAQGAKGLKDLRSNKHSLNATSPRALQRPSRAERWVSARFGLSIMRASLIAALAGLGGAND